MCEKTANLFKDEINLLNLHGRFIVVGDIHGDIISLTAVLTEFLKELSKGTSVLFLGDYVDRGPNGIEVITTLFELKNLFPQKVFLLRGNHEDARMNGAGGFKAEIDQKFSSHSAQVFKDITNIWEKLPICAVINDAFFCVHGGISAEYYQLPDPEKYLFNFREMLIYRNPDLIQQMLWSDPYPGNGILPNPRGLGHLFGIDIIEDFCKLSKLKFLVRAHQAPSQANVKYEKLINVFSCLNHGPVTENQSCILLIDNFEKDSAPIFEIKYLNDIIQSFPTEFTKNTLDIFGSDFIQQNYFFNSFFSTNKNFKFVPKPIYKFPLFLRTVFSKSDPDISRATASSSSAAADSTEIIEYKWLSDIFSNIKIRHTFFKPEICLAAHLIGYYSNKSSALEKYEISFDLSSIFFDQDTCEDSELFKTYLKSFEPLSVSKVHLEILSSYYQIL